MAAWTFKSSQADEMSVVVKESSARCVWIWQTQRFAYFVAGDLAPVRGSCSAGATGGGSRRFRGSLSRNRPMVWSVTDLRCRRPPWPGRESTVHEHRRYRYPAGRLRSCYAIFGGPVSWHSRTARAQYGARSTGSCCLTIAQMR